MKKIIVLFLVVSYAGFSQSDSLSLEKKWEKSHNVGVELVGNLLPYSLGYKFSVTKNKHQIGLGYHGTIFKLATPLLLGNGFLVDYRYGKINKLSIDFVGGFYVEPKNIFNSFSFKLKNEKVNMYSISLLFGYCREIGRFDIGVSVGGFGSFIYNDLFPEENRIQFGTIPSIGLNCFYRLV